MRRYLFSCMVFHIADNSVFTLNIAVPCTKGGINILLRKRAQKLMELWIGLVDHFPVQTLTELRHIEIEPNQLHILRAKNRTAHSGIALDDSNFHGRNDRRHFDMPHPQIWRQSPQAYTAQTAPEG